ncbi:cytochrome P450 CYP72A219 isoform X2 [Cajanus cajan]|uniref:cytochrome P450 CYP72A219 isoform X2 n=1 Tax=Cajanus cajan TaxID=3821 RepID=UPI00098D8755|nr:cytochrome P450 CYP72A219 isoform X2 [Cajanus cajan]
MEDFVFKTMTSSFALLVLYIVIRFVNNIWWRPRSTEKLLRQQGIRGSSYKLFNGDISDMKNSALKASSKAISLNHQIVPRVIPFIHKMVQQHGNVSLCWFGRRPRLIVVDAELTRLVLTNKNGHFTKPPRNPLVKILTQGLSSLEGEAWTKRRRLVTSAFQLQKLKAMVPAFSSSCHNMIQRWEKLVEPNGSFELDVSSEFDVLAGDVIARTAFGSSYQEGKKIFELQKEQAILARAEVLGIFGKKAPDFEGINHLKIVSMILYEVLRLYPPITVINKYNWCETRVGNMSIPAGVEVCLPLLLLHYDGNYWEKPEEFNPVRFTEGVSKASKDHIAFYPFGWGPRICPGQNFAFLEAKMALATILQHFSFQLSPSYAHAPSNSITLKPQFGAPIVIRRI